MYISFKYVTIRVWMFQVYTPESRKKDNAYSVIVPHTRMLCTHGTYPTAVEETVFFENVTLRNFNRGINAQKTGTSTHDIGSSSILRDTSVSGEYRRRIFHRQCYTQRAYCRRVLHEMLFERKTESITWFLKWWNQSCRNMYDDEGRSHVLTGFAKKKKKKKK